MSYLQSDSLNELARECHKIAVDHGFWDYPQEVSKHMQYMIKIALIHSEATEALQEVRSTNSPEPTHKDEHWDKFGDELVDIIIRVLDLADDAGIDTDRRMTRIMEQNRNRPYKHGKLA
jgi:NTP pyrophosphatase (non-canonical NTP hydrolase)